MLRANAAPSVLRQPSIGHTAMSRQNRVPTGRATAVYAPALTTEPPSGIQHRQRARHRKVGHQHRGHDHHEVGDVVRAVLRGERLDLVVVLADLAVAVDQAGEERQTGRDHDRQEEVGRHGVLGESVDGLDETGARDERAEHHEDERDGGGEHAPALEAAMLAVHREAVDHRDAGQPAHEARVLDGVPCPETAPAEHDVGPHRAERHADGQEDEAEDGMAIAQLDPAGGEVAGDQRSHGVGERDGHPRVAQEGRGRVQDHRQCMSSGFMPPIGEASAPSAFRNSGAVAMKGLLDSENTSVAAKRATIRVTSPSATVERSSVARMRLHATAPARAR